MKKGERIQVYCIYIYKVSKMKFIVNVLIPCCDLTNKCLMKYQELIFTLWAEHSQICDYRQYNTEQK